MASMSLSKSRYLLGLQCLKYLWLSVNQPDCVPQPDAQTQHIFDQGHLVQQYAEKLFPEGIRVPEAVFKGGGDLTARMLSRGKTFFEAGISVNSLYSRIDVLQANGNGGWNIIEVKSATRVKDENYDDVSFQKYCCQSRGLVIDRCYLLHINNKYVKHGEIDSRQLFTLADITKEVVEREAGFAERIASIQEMMQSPAPPDIRPGMHCKAPYECPVTLCRESLPPNNILELYRGGAKAFELLYNGTLFLRDIPDTTKLSNPQQVQKWCDAQHCHFIDKPEIARFLQSLKFPVHYLDFETINPAVPLFDGTRPFQQVPFQFSLHVVDKQGTMPWHFGFLASSPDDPRPAFLAALAKAIGKKGSIVVYNQSFEDSVLKDLGEAFPEHRDWTDRVRSRMVDLLQPFRDFSYYHPGQKGSASIKQVLPALTGTGYDDLDIGEGEEASRAYLDMTFGNMTADLKAKTRAALEQYCTQDTAGMIAIIHRLQELT